MVGSVLGPTAEGDFLRNVISFNTNYFKSTTLNNTFHVWLKKTHHASFVDVERASTMLAGLGNSQPHPSFPS